MQRRACSAFGVWRGPAHARAVPGLAHCSNSSGSMRATACRASARLVDAGEPVPKGGGVYRVGSPYVVAGRVYVPEDNPHYRAEGIASWYGSDFHGRATANGEIFDADSISAAHPTLPLPSYVRVTNLSNGHSLIVRVNDRGPYAANRLIDVSRRAARLLGFTIRGTAWVRVEYVGRAPIEGSDDRVLEATLRENGPAPAPGDTRIAATSLVAGFPAAAAAVRHQRLASASVTAAMPRLSPAGSARCPLPRARRRRRHRSIPQRTRALLIWAMPVDCAAHDAAGSRPIYRARLRATISASGLRDRGGGGLAYRVPKNGEGMLRCGGRPADGCFCARPLSSRVRRRPRPPPRRRKTRAFRPAFPPPS